MCIAEDRGVLYYRDGQLPTPYIVLNDPRSEGLFFTCITTSGTLTVTSENTTVSVYTINIFFGRCFVYTLYMYMYIILTAGFDNCALELSDCDMRFFFLPFLLPPMSAIMYLCIYMYMYMCTCTMRICIHVQYMCYNVYISYM